MRIVAKQDQAFRNARRVNPYPKTFGKKMRRFRYWMRVGARHQDRAIRQFSDTNL